MIVKNEIFFVCLLCFSKGLEMYSDSKFTPQSRLKPSSRIMCLLREAFNCVSELSLSLSLRISLFLRRLFNLDRHMHRASRVSFCLTSSKKRIPSITSGLQRANFGGSRPLHELALIVLKLFSPNASSNREYTTSYRYNRI